MLAVTTFTLLLVMAMAMIRGFAGPSIFDRVLAANLFGTKTVLLIAVLGFLFGRPEFLDIALLYALMNFISVIAILRYFENTQKAEEGRSADE
ncbi:monovalent cation/H+ antiporter complex subunit F [Zhongshania sp.]